MELFGVALFNLKIGTNKANYSVKLSENSV
jgi:hypothetical protein